MNPYLEHPDRWSTVHNRLIVTLADALTPQLLPQYQVDIEKNLSGWGQHLVGRADVSSASRTSAEAPTVVAPSPTEPVKVTVPLTEEVAYL